MAEKHHQGWSREERLEKFVLLRLQLTGPGMPGPGTEAPGPGAASAHSALKILLWHHQNQENALSRWFREKVTPSTLRAQARLF